MKTNELCSKLGCTLLTPPETADKEVTGCYLCDLLSNVMGRAEKGDAWITIMTNINIVAVALLADVACVIVPEGNEIEKAVLERAAGEGIAILSSSQTAYQLAVGISKFL